MRVKIMALAAAFTASLFAGGVHADPLQIRLSFIVPVSNWATILMQKPELAKHLGKTYSFEPVHFQGTPQLIQALATGEIEIGNFGFTSFPLAITNAGMDDLRIIADELQDGVPGYFSDEFRVNKDSPIKTVEDLKGKIVGVNAFGSGTDIPARIMLLKHGLTPNKDVSFVEGPIPALPAMMAEHKIDIFPAVLPFVADPKLQESTRTIFTQGDAMGITQLGMWAARKSFIDKNRAVMIDFMEDAIRAERWYFDPANHEDAVKIAVAVTKIPPERWESWLFKKDGQKGDYYRNKDAIPDVPSLQSAVDQQTKYGDLKQQVDLKKYVDLSLAEEAVKRLK